MRKAYHYIFPGLVFAFFILLAPGAIIAATFVNGDFLRQGEQSTGADLIDEQLFSELKIDIDKRGTLTGESSIPLSQGGPGYTYEGTANISINGTVNKNGKITGTFSKTHDYTFVHETNVMKNEGAVKLFYDGTISGNSAPDGKVTLNFEGTKRDVLNSKHSDGTTVDRDDSVKWKEGAVFSGSSRRFILDELLDGEPEEEVEEELVEDGVDEVVPEEEAQKLEKSRLISVVGDVSYSDEGEEVGVLKLASRMIRSVVPFVEEPISDDREYKVLETKVELRDGSLIQTDTDVAVLKYADDSKIIMEKESVMEVTDEGSFLKDGSAYYEFKKASVPLEPIEIETTQLKLKVTGTQFSVETDGEFTTVRLVEGELEIIPEGGSELVLLAAGESIRIAEAGPEAVSEFDAAAEKAAWEQIEAEAPDTVTSDVEEPVALTLILTGVVFLVFVAGIILLIWFIRKRLAGKSQA